MKLHDAFLQAVNEDSRANSVLAAFNAAIDNKNNMYGTDKLLRWVGLDRWFNPDAQRSVFSVYGCAPGSIAQKRIRDIMANPTTPENKKDYETLKKFIAGTYIYSGLLILAAVQWLAVLNNYRKKITNGLGYTISDLSSIYTRLPGEQSYQLEMHIILNDLDHENHNVCELTIRLNNTYIGDSQACELGWDVARNELVYNEKLLDERIHALDKFGFNISVEINEPVYTQDIKHSIRDRWTYNLTGEGGAKLAVLAKNLAKLQHREE